MPISNQIVSFKLSSANFSGTVTQLNYTSGVNEGTALPSKALVLDSSKIISGIERINANTLNATNLIGTLTTSSQPNITSLGTLSNLIVSNNLTLSGHNGTNGLILGGTLVTASATQLNYNNITTIGSAQASKALILDSSRNITNINLLTTAGLTLGSTAITASGTEINTLTGVTPGIVSLSKTVIVDSSKDITGFRNITLSGTLTATNLTGLLSTAAQTNITSLGSLTGLTTAELTLGSTTITATGTEINKLAGLSTTALELSTLAGVTAGTVSLSKAIVVDANKDITGFRNISVTGSISGVTALSATNLTGVLTTSDQPNITSVGALSSLTVNGTNNSLTIKNLTSNSRANILFTNDSKNVEIGLRGSTDDVSSNSFYIFDSAFRFIIDPTGNIGIGSISSSYKLHVAGSLNCTSFYLNGSQVTSNSTELNYLAGLTTGSITLNKAVVVDANKDISGFRNISLTGSLTSTLATSSTSNSTGTLLLSGGIGISNTTDAISSTNGGTFTSAGGGAFAKSLFVGTNLTVGGNLTISGTTTSVNSTTVNVADNTIILNSGPAGTGIDAGILTQRYQIANDLGTGDIVGDTATANFAISSGTTSTIVLPGSASAVDNYYTNWWIKMTSGSANNNVRKVTNYVGSTKTLTLETVLSATPSASNTINLYNNIYPTFIWQESNKRFITATTTIDSSGTIAISDYSDLASRNIILSSTTSSTSNLTGALKLSGGIGISNTTDATNSTNGGTFTSAGGGAFAKSLFIGTTLTTASLTLGATAITATGTEINTLAGVSAGTISLSKAVVVDANKDINGFRNISVTGTISGVTTLTATSLTLSGALTGVSTIGASGIVSLTNNTTSSSTTTGALVVTGGVGIGGELNLAGNINLPNASTGINMGNTSNSGYCQIYMKTNTAQYSISTSGNGSSPNGLLQFHAFNSSGGFLGTTMTMQGLNVGIGTTSPSYKLDINGSLNSSSFYLSGSQVTSSAAELNYLDITSAGSAQASKALVLDSSSNISSINDLTASRIIASKSSNGEMFTFNNGTSTGRLYQFNNGEVQFGLTSANPFHMVTNNSVRLSILSNGNVGINNTSPSYILDVSGNVRFNSSIIINSSTFCDSARNTYAGAISASSYVDSSSYMNCLSGYRINGTTVIDSSRNLTNIGSIGASSSVSGSMFSTGGYYYTGQGGYSGSYVSNWPYSSYWGIGADSSSSNTVRIGTCDSAGSWYGYGNLRVNSFYAGGYVGIGTASPVYPLQVTSTAGGDASYNYFYYLGPGSSNGSTTTTPSNVSIRSHGRVLVSGEIDVISDYRKKENIKLLDQNYCNNFVKNIKPKEFNYKNEPNGKLFGYIAQDLIKGGFEELIMVEVDPESKEFIDEDGFKSEAGKTYTLSRSQIIAILHNSLKTVLNNVDDLNNENEELKQKNQDLENKYNNLTIELNQLKELVNNLLNK